MLWMTCWVIWQDFSQHYLLTDISLCSRDRSTPLNCRHLKDSYPNRSYDTHSNTFHSTEDLNPTIKFNSVTMKKGTRNMNKYEVNFTHLLHHHKWHIRLSSCLLLFWDLSLDSLVLYSSQMVCTYGSSTRCNNQHLLQVPIPALAYFS